MATKKRTDEDPTSEAATERARRSNCPVACALDVIGDRWTLLLVRDLLAGPRRYGDFLAASERIPTNILADRLRRLARAGLVTREQYSERPPRYEYALTAAGQELAVPIRALADWGTRHFPGTRARSPRPRTSAVPALAPAD